MQKIIILIFILFVNLFSNKLSSREVNLVGNVDFSTYDLKFNGTIDNRLHISVYLNQVGDKIRGIYFYENNKYYLTLDGTIGKTGRCIIFENNYKGRITGKFEGVLRNEGFKGTWNNTDNTKRYNFELVNQAPLMLGESKASIVSENKFQYSIILFVIGFISLVGGIFYYKKRKSKQMPNESPLIQTSTNINPGIDIDKLSSKIVQDLKDAKVAIPNSKDTDDQETINKKKGDIFERFVVDKFAKANKIGFPKMFNHVTWQGDKRSSDGNFAKTNGNPDLIYDFKLPEHNATFAVECKWRKKDKKIKFAEITQITRYKRFSKSENIDVYIVIGIGDNPQAPDELFVIPLNDVDFPEWDYDFLKENYLIPYFFYDTVYDMLNPPAHVKNGMKIF